MAAVYQMIRVPAAASPVPTASPGPYRVAWLRIIGAPVARVTLLIATLYVVLATLAPLLPLDDPASMDREASLQSPSIRHLLGTDQFGRDILSRVIFGARVSLTVALTATGLGIAVGVATGVLAGYRADWSAAVIMRIYDALLAFPTILLAIAITATTGPGALNAALALAIVSMPQFARVARAGVLSEKAKDYVLAARSLGLRDGRVMFRHILPNITGPLLAQLTLFMAFAVLVESALSFLGLGTQPPAPSWGSMLTDGRPYFQQAPWYSVAPGLALTVLIFTLNTLADAVGDAFNPRLMRSSR